MMQGNLCSYISVDTYISYNICASADNDTKNHRKMENNSFTRDVFKTKLSLKILCFLLVLIIVGYCISIYFVPSVLSVLQQENCLFPTLQLLLTLIFFGSYVPRLCTTITLAVFSFWKHSCAYYLSDILTNIWPPTFTTVEDHCCICKTVLCGSWTLLSLYHRHSINFQCSSSGTLLQ